MQSITRGQLQPSLPSHQPPLNQPLQATRKQEPETKPYHKQQKFIQKIFSQGTSIKPEGVPTEPLKQGHVPIKIIDEKAEKDSLPVKLEPTSWG